MVQSQLLLAHMVSIHDITTSFDLTLDTPKSFGSVAVLELQCPSMKGIMEALRINQPETAKAPTPRGQGRAQQVEIISWMCQWSGVYVCVCFLRVAASIMYKHVFIYTHVVMYIDVYIDPYAD